MKDLKRDIVAHASVLSLPPRRGVLVLAGLTLLLPLAACDRAERKAPKDIVLDVEMFSYVDHVITRIQFNGSSLGIMNRYGGTGVLVGVRVPFGPQTLTWTLGGPKGTPRNGEKIQVKNALVVTPEQIPANTRYMGLHLYPDDTAELTFSEDPPERTARGRRILDSRKANGSSEEAGVGHAGPA